MNNPAPITYYPKSEIDARLEVDACDVGWGAIMHVGDRYWTANGPFINEYLQLHITGVPRICKWSRVLHLNHGARKRRNIKHHVGLHHHRLKLQQRRSIITSREHHAQLQAKIASSKDNCNLTTQNSMADRLSRYHDRNEVTLRQEIFKMAEHHLNYKVKIDGLASPEKQKHQSSSQERQQEGHQA